MGKGKGWEGEEEISYGRVINYIKKFFILIMKENLFGKYRNEEKKL